MEVLTELPKEAAYTLLAEHQAQTPASFYTGPPILHLVLRQTTLSARQQDFDAVGALARLAQPAVPAVNGHAETVLQSESAVTISDLEIWVASDKLVLVRPSASTAIAIPYPSILLHAVASTGLYLQLKADASFEDQDEDALETVEVTLKPASESVGTDGLRPVEALYQALSACADLHPDAMEQDSENGDEEDAEGGDWPALRMASDGASDELLYQVTAPAGEGQPVLPPPMPGSSGWITAENMDQFFDEEGNWKGRELGPGAGTVRERETEEQGGDDGTEVEETKWQRTD